MNMMLRRHTFLPESRMGINNVEESASSSPVMSLSICWSNNSFASIGNHVFSAQFNVPTPCRYSWTGKLNRVASKIFK